MQIYYGKKEGGTGRERERERNEAVTMVKVMVVLHEITGFASTRLSSRECAKWEREKACRVREGCNLTCTEAERMGKRGAGEEGRKRRKKDTAKGDCVACVRIASWRDDAGRGNRGERGRGWKREEPRKAISRERSRHHAG